MKKTKALLKMEEQAQETLLDKKNLGTCACISVRRDYGNSSLLSVFLLLNIAVLEHNPFAYKDLSKTFSLIGMKNISLFLTKFEETKRIGA